MGEIATKAAEWLVRLSDEEQPPKPQELEEFEYWLAADVRHEQAIRRLQGITGTLESMPSQAAHAALDADVTANSSANWQLLATAMLVFVAVLLPAFYLQNNQSLTLLLADKQTEHQQWRSWTLADKSVLTLSGNSALDIQFDAHKRQLDLLQGDLLIDVAHDASRALEVTTEHGVFRAMGTRFLVQKRQNKTLLTVMESEVRVWLDDSNDKAQGISVKAGQQLVVTDTQIGSVMQTDAQKIERNWRNGQYVVSARPLPEVLQELARYQQDYLIYDENALQDIMVNGVFPLKQPNKALMLVNESLPVELHYYPWVVSVSLQEK